MTADPLVLMAEVNRATDRLPRTARTLDGPALESRSHPPGWTRGHVLTHLARNADGLTNLLTCARTGVVTPQYVSEERRNSDIDEGAGRGPEEHLGTACARFAAAAEAMPADAWTVKLDVPAGPQPAARVVWRRLREVEMHHVDLDAGYGAADWPDAFAQRLLTSVTRWPSETRPGHLRSRDGPPRSPPGSPDAAPEMT